MQRVRGYFRSCVTARVAAEAAAAFHFEDSGWAAAREVVGAKAEPAAAEEAGEVGWSFAAVDPAPATAEGSPLAFPCAATCIDQAIFAG